MPCSWTSASSITGPLALHQCRPARSPGRLPPRGSGLPEWPCALERGRGFHSSDHRLAGICPGHLLAENARVPGSELLRRDPAAPDFYWTGETDLARLQAAITHQGEAYAHHIQRLMVTGNFALLAGIDPKEVHEWYLLVYADAYEWVELPNTLGMSLFADGGLLGSKPYAASGNYINKMSDYCAACRFDVKQKTGEKPAPSMRSIGIFSCAMKESCAAIRAWPRSTAPGTAWRRRNRPRIAERGQVPESLDQTPPGIGSECISRRMRSLS